MKLKPRLFAVVFAVGLAAQLSFAHCQIPCGIYSDAVQFDILEEHYATIEKSMNEVNGFDASSENYNQIVRWVTNKEAHAQKVQDMASAYFLAQRIKPDQADYERRVVLLHQIIVAAMKTKQTTDVAHVATLRELTAEFRKLYFSEADEDHVKDHHQE